MATGQSRIAVITAIACTAVIAATKFFAAVCTGSAAMTAEAIHSLVDTANSGLLYLGLRRSVKPPDKQHPFGYGMEL